MTVTQGNTKTSALVLLYPSTTPEKNQDTLIPLLHPIRDARRTRKTHGIYNTLEIHAAIPHRESHVLTVLWLYATLSPIKVVV